MSRHARPLDTAVQHIRTAAAIIKEISDSSNTASFLKPVAGVCLLLSDSIQAIKSNKDQCIRMSEQIYEILCAIINMCGSARPGTELPLATMRSLAQFLNTLQQIHVFVRSQTDASLMKRLVKYKETAALVAECNAGLKHALDVLGIQSSLMTAMMAMEIHEDEQKGKKSSSIYCYQVQNHLPAAILYNLDICKGVQAQYLCCLDCQRFSMAVMKS